MKYGRDMMRYGFHEMGMPGGTNKYPGYYSSLSDETIKKLNAEQESFIKSTEDLRQTIYEKELYLKAELVKKSPDLIITLSLQNEISETRGIFEQHMIEHIIRMKKINLDAERK
jgi:zinc resistance-associated protein